MENAEWLAVALVVVFFAVAFWGAIVGIADRDAQDSEERDE